MPTQKKKELVAEFIEMIGRSSAIYIAEYRGLTVAEITELRRKIREAGGQLKVAKNRLMKIALSESNLPIPEDLMTGPNSFTFVYDDPVAVAKVMVDFSKEHDAFKIKGGIMEGNVIDTAAVKSIASLPPKEVLLAQVVGAIAAPLRGLVTVLSGPMRGLVTALSQIKEKKEKEAA